MNAIRTVFRFLMAAVAPALIVLATASCARAPIFKDQPIVWHADDQRDVPKEPKERKYVRPAYWLEVYGFRRVTRLLEVRGKRAAMNTNALDEVPNSTWWTNRIGVRNVTPEEAAQASSASGPPQMPLTVTGGKGGGTRPGFFAKDKTGRKFLIKFDFLANPDMQTGTGVIANRLFWAIGYEVPSEHLFYLDKKRDLLIGPDAKLKNEFLKKKPFKMSDLDAMFATSPIQPDGRYRLYASELLEGKPIGGARPEGKRRDDINDVVPHEHRRELRGLRVFGAWLGHTDIKEDNTLDMWVEEDGKHFVRHYLVDVNECLGSHQANMGRLEDGWEYNVDWEMSLKALLTFGIWKRPWEDQKQTKWPSVGAFSAKHFDPEKWRPAFPYFPFFETTDEDAYWAAKIVMRFDRPILEAVVAKGELPADASRYLVDTLLERARRIGRAYIDNLTPVDAFELSDGQLCGHDLSVYYGLASYGVVEHLGRRGKPQAEYTVDRHGRFCMPLPRRQRYTVFRLRTRRTPGIAKKPKPAMEIHLKTGASPRILGIVRKAR